MRQGPCPNLPYSGGQLLETFQCSEMTGFVSDPSGLLRIELSISMWAMSSRSMGDKYDGQMIIGTK